MFICCYCGGQVSLNHVFDHAFAEHSVPRYDERIYIPTYEVYRNLSVEVQTEPEYAMHVENMQTQIRRLYQILLVTLEDDVVRPILDIGDNPMGLIVQLYTPGSPM